MRYSKKAKKRTAMLLFFVLASELVFPNIALALTTGPTQPEVQSFEPVGTTDMVDMFSGDFNYNIPLMDVEGYPVNISYHGGVTMEQEASWVGLGWNINPGVINRTVRGLPDDFNGDTLSKELHIKDEKTLRVGTGFGVEAFGVGDPLLTLSASLGANITFNNYKGTSCDFDLGVGVNLFRCASAGVNIGVGSATGASIDYNAGLSLSSSQIVGNDVSAGIGVGVTQGYSSRSGLKDLNFSYSGNMGGGASSAHGSITKTIPIGIRNFVPVITNSNIMRSFYGRFKFGGEFFWCHPYFTMNGMYSKNHFYNDGDRKSYGYMYLDQSGTADAVPYRSILDFTRDKDGNFNKSMQYLSPAALTYDIYAVNGQGTGGMFRPYRNDIGCVYDPVTKSEEESHSLALEAGLGYWFEIGGDFTESKTKMTSGPWEEYVRGFTGKTVGSVYEDVYMKQGGELTEVDSQYFLDISGYNVVSPERSRYLPGRKANSASKRDARGNLIYYFTAKEDTFPGVGTSAKIVSYNNNGFEDGPDADRTYIDRIEAGRLGHKKDEVSEIVQLQKDGRKYVYGIPALNHIQKEATFSVNPSLVNLNSGTVTYTPGTTDAVGGNNLGRDEYYSATMTPSYIHSYLLTSVLSNDYVDVTGNGPTDDDLGSYTKLNYSRKSTDYRWKAPYGTGVAQYNPGFWSDKKDDKGSYVSGSREQWLLHSIETRNFVAEFYTSERNDGVGSAEPVVTGGRYNVSPYCSTATAARSYKLDSIKLYNKHDRFINMANAIPIKTVFFAYTDTLCKGIPNAVSTGSTRGKLTLNKIYFRYGNSQRSLISPYEFGYGFNPDYDLACKDRWGSYKPNNDTFTNYEFPFVNQNDTSNNTYASAWSLTEIRLPSGGVITTEYESDDYAYVQDKRAQEMFMVQGVGQSPYYKNTDQLYGDEKTPYLYVYFKRSTVEGGTMTFDDKYFGGGATDILYYNFNIQLTTSSRSYEQIKGYANFVNSGICPNNSSYGYIELKHVDPTAAASEINLHPATYTALNYGRYHLPGVIYPGSEADPDDGFSMLDGLKSAFSELVNIFNNPIVTMVKKKDYAKYIDLKKSFIRLNCPGMYKKGGGQRVKQLAFHDAWNTLTGGNEHNASYGKKYYYEIDEDGRGRISSGVASYEPMVGGDENPFRQPVPYIVASGSNWPPNDPVDLYQETPIGESLFPPPSVGYRRVLVTSINGAYGKSSRGADIYQFYTARDFPVKVATSAINSSFHHRFSFFRQENGMVATQGFAYVFNDMHGKPKSVEHYNVLSGGHNQMISYQKYNYRMKDGQLDNYVPCLVSNPTTERMEIQNRQLGIEADVIVDSRKKEEKTKNNTLNSNLNVGAILWLTIPIPFAFPWRGDYDNTFNAATVTKVVQQYGILDNVEAYDEGAVTVQQNELFDPQTGQVVVSSINNEFQDREYTTNVPAYWGYIGMSTAYNNIKYELQFPSMAIDALYRGVASSAPANLHVGDQLYCEFKDAAGEERKTILWYTASCSTYFLPRFPLNTPGWVNSTTITNVRLKVINSGAKNMLNETLQSYTTLGSPIDGAGHMRRTLDSVISINAKTYCDSNTRGVGRYIRGSDTINPYVIGQRGIYRVKDEYAYIANRNYNMTTGRNAGLFKARTIFVDSIYDQVGCYRFPGYYMVLSSSDPNWRVARSITKWSPFGKEVENVDAIGNYSTAVYGYNEDLPVAVASNAQQGEVIGDGFEDYGVLQVKDNLMRFNYSPFRPHFPSTDLTPPSSVYDIFNLTGPSMLTVSPDAAHTGLHSLSVPGSAGTEFTMALPLKNFDYSLVSHAYDFYFPSSYYVFSSRNEYLPFQISLGKKYILSYWVRETSPSANATDYSLGAGCGVDVDGTFFPLAKRSNLIDGWQQVEAAFTVPGGALSVALKLPAGCYVDDLRIFPDDANMKSFVYHPVNEKLMATLDENNFATLYEYDQEGNLVRVKKETAKGIMTVSESRSSNPKK